MAKIVKGYKQGRGVAFYDIEEAPLGKVSTKVPKDEVVNLINSGKIANATIQWWQGKPIVRVKENIELVKIVALDSSGVTKEEPTAKRGQATRPVSINNEEIHAKAVVNSQVVGKLSKKKTNETIYETITKREIDEHRKVVSTINYKGMETLEDLLDTMIKDFSLKDVVTYKAMIAKKVKLNQKIFGLAQSNLLSIQESMAVYLMNMANMETRNTYAKYMRV